MSAAQQKPLEPFLFLHITEKCNLRCTHCYMGEKLEHERYMSPELVSEILKSMRILYGQYKVYLLGGEPTLHPQFSEVLKICKDEQYKVVLTSNGIIPEKTWTILTKDQIDCFAFSFDGATQERHEAMRGKNTYAPLLKSIKRAVDTGFQTRLIHTITNANITHATDILDSAESLGVGMMSFHYFTPTGAGGDTPELQVSPERWMEFCKQMDEESLRRKIDIIYPPTFIRKSDIAAVKEAGYAGCAARNLERFYIYPDRRVYLCNSFLDTDLNYGTFQNGQIIPQFKEATEMTLVGKAPQNCRSCIVSDFCKAGCAVFDHFNRTHTTKDCTSEIVPVCHLWSMPAGRQGVQSRTYDLR